MQRIGYASIAADVASRHARRIGIALAIVVLTACAGKEPPITEADRHPRTIAIIPVLPADEVNFDRGSMSFLYGVGFFVEKIDLAVKRQIFATRFAATKQRLATEVTDAFRDAATRRGYQTIVLTDIARTPRTPDDFDYSRIATNADAIVHVHIQDVGLFSPRLKNDYFPRLELEVRVAVHRTGALLIDENVKYGVDASEKDVWSVAADDRYRFADFADIEDHIDRVEEGWRAGGAAIAQLVVDRIDPSMAH